VQTRQPSGLFPSAPPRPTFREPHHVRLGPTLAGAGTAGAWLLLTGLFAETLRAYFWLTIFATAVAWAVAALLMRAGDRGAATGVAMVGGFGGTLAFLLFAVNWGLTGGPIW
jgi:hypothetical protein